LAVRIDFRKSSRYNLSVFALFAFELDAYNEDWGYLQMAFLFTLHHKQTGSLQRFLAGSRPSALLGGCGCGIPPHSCTRIPNSTTIPPSTEAMV